MTAKRTGPPKIKRPQNPTPSGGSQTADPLAFALRDLPAAVAAVELLARTVPPESFLDVAAFIYAGAIRHASDRGEPPHTRSGFDRIVENDAMQDVADAYVSARRLAPMGRVRR